LPTTLAPAGSLEGEGSMFFESMEVEVVRLGYSEILNVLSCGSSSFFIIILICNNFS